MKKQVLTLDAEDKSQGISFRQLKEWLDEIDAEARRSGSAEVGTRVKLKAQSGIKNQLKSITVEVLED